MTVDAMMLRKLHFPTNACLLQIAKSYNSGMPPLSRASTLESCRAAVNNRRKLQADLVDSQYQREYLKSGVFSDITITMIKDPYWIIMPALALPKQGDSTAFLSSKNQEVADVIEFAFAGVLSTEQIDTILAGAERILAEILKEPGLYLTSMKTETGHVATATGFENMLKLARSAKKIAQQEPET